MGRGSKALTCIVLPLFRDRGVKNSEAFAYGGYGSCPVRNGDGRCCDSGRSDTVVPWSNSNNPHRIPTMTNPGGQQQGYQHNQNCSTTTTFLGAGYNGNNTVCERKWAPDGRLLLVIAIKFLLVRSTIRMLLGCIEKAGHS